MRHSISWVCGSRISSSPSIFTGMQPSLISPITASWEICLKSFRNCWRNWRNRVFRSQMHRSRIRLRCFLSSRFDLGEAAKPVNPAVVSAFSPVKKWVLFVFLLILQLFGGWIIGKIGIRRKTAFGQKAACRPLQQADRAGVCESWMKPAMRGITSEKRMDELQ